METKYSVRKYLHIPLPSSIFSPRLRDGQDVSDVTYAHIDLVVQVVRTFIRRMSSFHKVTATLSK